MNVVAIIILYNPDLTKLQRLYDSVVSQVSAIVFVDNSPLADIQAKNQQWLNNLDNKVCHYVSMGQNVGIATAQNQGIKLAKALQAEFVSLFDQDSVLPNRMVDNLLAMYKKIKKQHQKVAVISPAFIDEKTNELSKLIRHQGLKVNKISLDNALEFEVTDYAIASGSLIPIDNFDNVGMMQDDLFIDWVDIEWGLRAKKLGYLSYTVPNVVMRHNIGDESVSIGSKNINLHSDFRNYFIVRNSVYLGLYSDLSINFRVIQLSKTPLYVLFYSYHSKRPLYSLKLLLTAIKDGVTKKMGKGHFSEVQNV